MNTFRDIKHWFRMNWTKQFFNLLKTVFFGYPYDYSYLLKIEQAKLLDMINHFEKVNSGERSGFQYNGMEHDIWYMKIAAKLLECMIDDTNLFHFDNNMSCQNDKDGRAVWVDKDGNPTNDHGYRCDVKVNMRNMGRFLKPYNKEIYLMMPHELYLVKASHLYHKIRFEKEQYWWE